MRRRVVVTGLGLVTPLGVAVADTWAALLEGRSGCGPITRFDPTGFGVRIAHEVKGFDAQQYIDRKEARRFDLYAQYGIAAAAQAVAQAGLDAGARDKDRVAVIIGSGIGGMQTYEDNCRAFLQHGPDRVSPFFVPMFIPNICAGLVSMRHGFKGPNYAPVSACASSAHAIGEAFRLVRDGTCDAAVAGGAEACVTGLTVAAFHSMKAMSTRNDAPTRASRPFDRDRDGFVLGEGGACIVLEALEHALDRGATPLCELAGYGLSGDAYHISAPAPHGEGAQRAMRMCLADAGLAPADIAYVNAHGTSTPLGDVAETEAVKAVFGDHARRIVFGSTKSMTGHLLGGAGALEFVVSALSVMHGRIPPTINHETPDPECDLDCAPNGAVRRDVPAALSNAFGFGGHNATLAVRRFEA